MGNIEAINDVTVLPMKSIDRCVQVAKYFP